MTFRLSVRTEHEHRLLSRFQESFGPRRDLENPGDLPRGGNGGGEQQPPQADKRRPNFDLKGRERAAQSEDAKQAEQLLGAIEKGDLSRDLPREANDALTELHEHGENKTSIVLLLRLLIALLGQANGSPPAAPGNDTTTAPTAGTGVTKLHDGAAVVRGANAEPKLHMPGEPYIEDGSLDPHPLGRETAGKRAARWDAVSHDLAGGATEQDFRSRQEKTIDDCDAALEKKVGAGRRDTLESRRREAQRNLATLDEIKANRIAACAKLNEDKETLSAIRRLKFSSGVRPFEATRYAVCSNLDVALVGVKPFAIGETIDINDGKDGAFRISADGSSISISHWYRGGQPAMEGASGGLIYDSPDGRSMQYWSRENLVFEKSADGLYRVRLKDDAAEKLRGAADDERDMEESKRRLDGMRINLAEERLFQEQLDVEKATRRRLRLE